MFIEQSSARRNTVRVLFLVAACAPCAMLAAAAWWRHSAGHVATIARAASAYLGLPVSVGAVAHPRPGVIRLTRVIVGDVAGDAMGDVLAGRAHDDALVLPLVEVEMAAGEVRVSAPRFECSPSAARMLAGIASEWLGRPERFPEAWVVDVGEVVWRAGGDGLGPIASGWHVECVAAAGSRAVRCRREPAGGDEIRVHKTPAGIAVEGALEQAVPLTILAGFVPGLSRWAVAAGDEALVHGAVDMHADPAGWSGAASGIVERATLASLMAAGGADVAGEATITATDLRARGGRIVAGDVVVVSSAGTLPQRVLDGLVGSLGCRPGPAYRSIGNATTRRFDRLGCRVQLEDGGLRLRAVDGGGGSLVGAQGLSLVDEPAGLVPATRLAWFLSPEGRPAVPATTASAWLMSVLPEPGGF
jgi:hypothetical protein